MKCRSVLCAVLAFCIVLFFSACDRIAGDEGSIESGLPVETGGGGSIAPSEETPGEASSAVSTPPDASEGRSDLVILNWEEYVNRPHEIQPGTVLNFQNELNKAGVKMGFDILRPEDSSIPLLTGKWTIIYNNFGYRNIAPYSPWQFILKPNAPIKACWQNIYDPELYQKMLNEYDAMTISETWEEMLSHSRQLTTYVQDDFGAIIGVQPPAFVALSKDFKNGIYFTEQHNIQLYYLYK